MIVGKRILGWEVGDADPPLPDPCASLWGMSLTDFRDRGIRIEVIRQIGTVEM